MNRELTISLVAAAVLVAAIYALRPRPTPATSNMLLVQQPLGQMPFPAYGVAPGQKPDFVYTDGSPGYYVT